MIVMLMMTMVASQMLFRIPVDRIKPIKLMRIGGILARGAGRVAASTAPAVAAGIKTECDGS